MKSRVFAAATAFVVTTVAGNGIAFADPEADASKRIVGEYQVASLERSSASEPKTPYAKIISTYAKKYGVPVELAHAVVKVESNFNPRARGSAGEIGLMQIKPATARMMGYSGSSKGLYDPETNIQFGMKYLAMAQDLGGGDTCGTILKYNAGHAAKRMNPVSRAYCQKVKAIMR